MGNCKPRAGFDKKKMDALYHKWGRVKKSGISIEFKDFDEFVNFAAAAGYDYGKKLVRLNRNGPYSQENCVFKSPEESDEYHKMLVSKWESIMSPIRERFKEELAEIERRKPKGKQYFRYEHPDLVREGIVFEG